MHKEEQVTLGEELLRDFAAFGVDGLGDLRQFTDDILQLHMLWAQVCDEFSTLHTWLTTPFASDEEETDGNEAEGDSDPRVAVAVVRNDNRVSDATRAAGFVTSGGSIPDDVAAETQWHTTLRGVPLPAAAPDDVTNSDEAPLQGQPDEAGVATALRGSPAGRVAAGDVSNGVPGVRAIEPAWPIFDTNALVDQDGHAAAARATPADRQPAHSDESIHQPDRLVSGDPTATELVLSPATTVKSLRTLARFLEQGASIAKGAPGDSVAGAASVAPTSGHVHRQSGSDWAMVARQLQEQVQPTLNVDDREAVLPGWEQSPSQSVDAQTHFSQPGEGMAQRKVSPDGDPITRETQVPTGAELDELIDALTERVELDYRRFYGGQ